MSETPIPTLEDIPIDKDDITVELQPSNNKFILITVLIVILILALIFSTVFALLNLNSTKIINGISIHGIDVSGLTIDEALIKLQQELGLENTYALAYEDYTNTISATDIEFVYDLNKAVEQAYKIGRDENIFINNFNIFSSLINPRNIELSYTYNTEKLDLLIKNIALELPGLVVQPSYYIEDSTLIITAGSSGIELCSDELKNLVICSIDTQNYNIDIPVNNIEPNAINIEQIYSEVHTEPQNAYIENNPFKLYIDVDGIDFAISLEEAKSLLNEEKSEYEIPLKISKADIQVADLGSDLFVDTLSTYSSRYDVSNKNRSTNVELATQKINDVILLPGETFSYNQTVGKRTIAAGFKEASIYTSSGIEYGVGGGICQVSSTLYNAVLEANLEIVERKNHSYSVSYVPLGRDATVSYGSIDFKFKNNRTYPIKISASAKNGVCAVSVVGLKEETEYSVSIQTQRLQTIPFQTTYINDSTLASGTTVVKQNGFYGYKYETYKVVSVNGSIISKELISTDTYKPLNKIVRVGTR